MSTDYRKGSFRDPKEEEEFRKYREQMHGTEEEEAPRKTPGGSMRYIFGIFMILVYLGMGILCVTNFFGYPDNTGWTVGRWVVGVVLIIYGVWRAYRQFAGIDSRF